MKIRVERSWGAASGGDCVVFGLFEKEKPQAGPAFRTPAGAAALEALRTAVRAGKFTGKKGEVFRGHNAGKSYFFSGLGEKKKYSLSAARVAFAKAYAEVLSVKAVSAAFDLEGFRGPLGAEEAVRAAAEGLRLAAYRFRKYKSGKKETDPLREAVLVCGAREDAARLRACLKEAGSVLDGVYFARDLANEPGNEMTPVVLARRAKEMASASGLLCRVLGKAAIRRLGMGGLLGVSKGSAYPPQFIVLENRVRRRGGAPVVLVGKGITFDSGGISIKPSNDMDKMKFDMCGAAAVLGAMKAVAALKLPVKVIGLVPVCENMPGSTAQRPGDILRCLNGKTVEVLNTDAEGRLILADALAYAKRFSPKALIDIATLTGACAVTFADLAIGLMGTDPELVATLKKAGEATGERCWELPLWEEYHELITATYADIQNISKRYAGTITAGMFLKQFAGHTRSWAHLDIAGTAYNEGGAKPLSPIGATGVGVRLLVEAVRALGGGKR